MIFIYFNSPCRMPNAVISMPEICGDGLKLFESAIQVPSIDIFTNSQMVCSWHQHLYLKFTWDEHLKTWSCIVLGTNFPFSLHDCCRKLDHAVVSAESNPTFRSLIASIASAIGTSQFAAFGWFAEMVALVPWLPSNLCQSIFWCLCCKNPNNVGNATATMERSHFFPSQLSVCCIFSARRGVAKIPKLGSMQVSDRRLLRRWANMSVIGDCVNILTGNRNNMEQQGASW